MFVSGDIYGSKVSQVLLRWHLFHVKEGLTHYMARFPEFIVLFEMECFLLVVGFVVKSND